MQRLRRSHQNYHGDGGGWGGGEEFAYWAVSWIVLDRSRTLTIILIVLLQFFFSQYLWGSETLHKEVDQRLTQM